MRVAPAMFLLLAAPSLAAAQVPPPPPAPPRTQRPAEHGATPAPKPGPA
ncbi:MAG: hypothetical protein JOZ05_00045, partial [Acetobacteraceae bacterium]|nr:hypothetical protein [Acetobacteraceae bacterium]